MRMGHFYSVSHSYISEHLIYNSRSTLLSQIQVFNFKLGLSTTRMWLSYTHTGDCLLGAMIFYDEMLNKMA